MKSFLCLAFALLSLFALANGMGLYQCIKGCFPNGRGEAADPVCAYNDRSGNWRTYINTCALECRNRVG